MTFFVCPVCGYSGLEEEPWPEHGGGSHEICPSCGIQFGYDDAAGGHEAARFELWKEWRQSWIGNGMRWKSVGQKPPPNWNPAVQLKNIRISHGELS